MLPDLHVGAGGAAEEAAGLFANPPVKGFDTGAINAETNAGSHDMTRALNEAADLIDWFTTPEETASRLYARTASFCSGSSNNASLRARATRTCSMRRTHADPRPLFRPARSRQFDSWDQGISFFLPNMTWYQPPGYVHVMFTQTWAETTVQASAQAEGPITYTPAPQPGFLAAGDDLWSGLATLAQAEALCSNNFTNCVGITYDSTDPNPTMPVQVYLKSTYQFTPASGWTTLESSRALDTIPFSAQLTGGGKTLVVRAVNAANVSVPLSFDLAAGASFSGADGAGWSLTGPSGAADNTPGDPTAISPVSAPVPVAAGTHWAGSLPAFTVWVASFTLA